MNRIRIMNHAKFLPVAVLSLLLVAGCAAENEDGESLSTPLTFSTSVHTPTRAATDLTTDNLTTVGLFASFTQGNYNASTATFNFMYNQKLDKSSGTWTYSPVKFWPNNLTDKLSFFAYAPYVNEAVAGGSNPSFQGKTATGFPKLTYTVSATENSQVDLLAAVPLMNQTYETSDLTASGSIKFTMKHALSKITFSVKSEMKLKVTSLTVSNVQKTATLTFKDGGFDWGNYTGTQTLTAALAGGGIEVGANTVDAQPVATFFLLPNKASATFSVTYLQDGETQSISKANVALPLSWTQGESVNYRLNIKRDGLSVTVAPNNDWASGGADENLSSKSLTSGYKTTDL